MDAQTLFREGVLTLREKHDPVEARRLLSQSLKLDPKNEMAWLWLSRTTNDPQQKLICVERALKINPNSAQAMMLRAKLQIAADALPDGDPGVANHNRRSSRRQRRNLRPPVASTQVRATVKIEQYMAKAETLIADGDVEGALELWVRARPSGRSPARHAERGALPVQAELSGRCSRTDLAGAEAGTTSIPILPDRYRHRALPGRHGEADDLRERVALLPNADEDLIVKMVDYFDQQGQPLRATELLERALEAHPNSQRLLVMIGDIYQQTPGRKADAMMYYERAARMKSRSKAGKSAEKALSVFTPVMTDRERGSFTLALREAFGFGAVFLLLGWQDAGLNLAQWACSAGRASCCRSSAAIWW